MESKLAAAARFLTIKAGEVLSGGTTASAEVMLGEALARSLNANPGSSLTLLASTTDGALNAMDVQVKGTFSTGVPEIDKRLVYTDVLTAQKLLNTQRVSTLGVFLNRMEATLPAQARFAAAEPHLTVQTWVDQAAFYQGVKALYNRIFGALGIIIGVIVVFVVTNAMAMAIIERTREIGTLRAMGTLPGQLQRTLGLEGMVLGGAGAVVGAVIALATSVLLYVFPVQMPPPPGRSTGYPLTLAMLASAWVARKTVHQPVVAALAHTSSRLVLMQSPAEKGQKVLMLKDDFWLLMPNSQRPMRITPIQKLLGDASTGDIATMSWADDYSAQMVGEESCGEAACTHLSLSAARKGVTYQRIELWVGKAQREPIKADLYVQSDKLAKSARFVMDKPSAPTAVAEMVLLDRLSNHKETRVRYLARKERTVPEAWLNPMFLARNPSLD